MEMVFVDPPLPSSIRCRRSAYRLALPAVMLSAYGAMAFLWHWGPRSLYFDILSFIGLEPFHFPFLDIHAVLAAAECQRQGIDVYVFNPCDTIGRPHVYSPLWLVVTPAIVGTKVTRWVGLALDLLFILSLVSVLRPRTSREIWIYGLAVLSPTTVYAVERANNDLVVFLLILSGGMLLTVRQPYRLCAYALFLVSGLLKYYPLALLVFLIRERRRTAIALLILLGIFLISLGIYFRLELAKALANIPAQSYFSDSFSAQNLPFGVGEILGSSFSSTLIAISLLGALFAMAAAKALRIVRLLGRHTLDCDDTGIRLLAIGGILLGACFFAGQNINYRGI
jgi:Glycosyltransferase family 87